MRYRDLYREMTGGTGHRSIPAWAREVLSAVAADASSGGSAVTAVRHPLGFTCLPIERDGDTGVCVHVWSARLAAALPPAPRITTSQVHCHSWDLLSYVLYGSLRNELAEVADAGGDAATHRVCHVVSGPGHDDIEPTGRTVRYSRGRTAEHGAGEVYALPAGVFHSSVVPAGEEVATVALGRGYERGADLSLGPLTARPHRVTRARCRPEETAMAARLAAGRLLG